MINIKGFLMAIVLLSGQLVFSQNPFDYSMYPNTTEGAILHLLYRDEPTYFIFDIFKENPGKTVEVLANHVYEPGSIQIRTLDLIQVLGLDLFLDSIDFSLLLHAPDKHVRQKAIGVLLSIGSDSKSVIPYISQTLIEDTSYNVRQEAFIAMKYLCYEEFLEPLNRIKKDKKDPMHRFNFFNKELEPTIKWIKKYNKSKASRKRFLMAELSDPIHGHYNWVVQRILRLEDQESYLDKVRDLYMKASNEIIDFYYSNYQLALLRLRFGLKDQSLTEAELRIIKSVGNWEIFFDRIDLLRNAQKLKQ